MADNAFQRSIDQAARTLAAANADYQRLYDAINAIPAADRASGAARENEYADLSKQLDAAAKRSNASETAYQSALEQSDKAQATAKEFAPAGEKRQRLDTTSGNVLVAVTEIADGRGGWSNDPQTPPAKVDIPGVTPKAGATSITAAPTGEYILKDGVLEKNPAYVAPTKATPTGAVPTSQYVYDAEGKPVENPGYVAPKTADPTVNTTAKEIPDPNHPGQFMANPNYVGPTAGAQASDAAVASTAQGVAEANLATAQLALADAQRRARQSPNDEQAQLAITTAQKGLELANKGLEQAQAQTAAEAPGRLAQQQATLESTQQATQKGKLGDLYGRPDRIKQIRDLIASGEIKPQDADSMIAAEMRGTTVYDVQKQQAAEASTARGQDVSNKNQLASTFGSTFNQGMQTFGDLNKTGAIGSDATGKAFLATLGLAQDYLKSYAQPTATPTDYLGTGPSPIGGMVNAAQQQMAAPAALPAAPPPLPINGQPPTVAPVTINIGGQPGSPGTPPVQQPALLSPGYAGTQNDPRTAMTPDAFGSGVGNLYGAVPPSVNGLVGAASKAVPAGVEDVMALHPNAARRAGMLGGAYRGGT